MTLTSLSLLRAAGPALFAIALACQPAGAGTGEERSRLQVPPDAARLMAHAAQAPERRPMTERAMALAARSRVVAQPAAPPKNSCVNRVVLGAVVGAGAGGLAGYAILAANGGSDSAVAILRGYALFGAVAGLLAAGLSCGP